MGILKINLYTFTPALIFTFVNHLLTDLARVAHQKQMLDLKHISFHGSSPQNYLLPQKYHVLPHWSALASFLFFLICKRLLLHFINVVNPFFDSMLTCHQVFSTFRHKWTVSTPSTPTISKSSFWFMWFYIKLGDPLGA